MNDNGFIEETGNPSNEPSNTAITTPFVNEEVISSDKTKGEQPPKFPKLGDQPFDAYSIIVDTRKFEIENFWKRAYFFWGFISVIAGLYIGLFLKTQSESNLSNYLFYFLFILSFISSYFCFLFSLNARSGKFWQIHWENLAKKAEISLSKRGQKEIKIFSEKYDTTSIFLNEKFFMFKPYRTSVSKLTFLIGDLMTFIWLSIAIKDFSYLLREGLISFKYNSTFSVNALFTISLIVFILFQIIALFINKKRIVKSTD